jgi:hypothetical protein
MPGPVDRAFREWTSGLDPTSSRIAIFQQIRDIPYSLNVRKNPGGTPAERILLCGRGSCGPKHYLLAEMYRHLGLEVAYATFPFLWDDPGLLYPPDLRRLATGLPVAYHLACRVRIDNRWVLVDATWDRGLKKGGFPINEHWDGRADTRCAVKPLKSAVRTAFCRTATNEPCRQEEDSLFRPLDGEEDHGDEDDQVRYYRQKTGIRSPGEIGRIQQFYPAFDAWLEQVRQE